MDDNRCISACHDLKHRCPLCPKEKKSTKIIAVIILIVFSIAMVALTYRILNKPDYAYNISIK